MSIIKALVVQAFILLLALCLGSAVFWRTKPPTTTSTTLRPFTRTPGLSLPVRNVFPVKCHREVPAIFSKYEKDVEVTGNSTNRFYNLVEECCEGYKRYDFDWSKCVPDCGNKCHDNGFCAEGSVCKCFNDFVLNHRNNCVSTCPLGCPNGQCYLNGTCICNHGYELDGNKKFCIPKCEYGCGRNEYCYEPNKCQCEEGYMRAIPDHKSMGCQPVCIPDCGFGTCVAPNQCQCFKNYYINGKVCAYPCEYKRCENGICIDSETCRCYDGYKYDNVSTTCLPDCGDECENGVCISPGVCRCFIGYERRGTKCVAVCPDGCGFNARCIAPGVCGCAWTDGPFKSFQQCANGTCTPRGRCRCNDDYTRYINACLPPGMISTYTSSHRHRLNQTLVNEFNLLIGQFFMFLPPRPTEWFRFD